VSGQTAFINSSFPTTRPRFSTSTKNVWSTLGSEK
jgi:hypothetical protein